MLKIVDVNFRITEINPFTNLPYDDSWVILCLTDSNEYQMMNGGKIQSAYVLKVSKQYPHWEMAVMDFIGYNENCGKNIIISVSKSDYEQAKKTYSGHSYNEYCLRSYESDVLVHSTTWDGWQSIKADSCLKSWNILKQEKIDWETAPIGKSLGDPKDFSDYIMFSDGGVSGEIVVASKQKGYIEMNTEAEYIPGARMYFDVRKIAEDGLLVRDGAHLKVKDKLPLKPYLLFVADWQSVGLKNNISTPQEFTKLANETFEKIHKRDN